MNQAKHYRQKPLLVRLLLLALFIAAPALLTEPLLAEPQRPASDDTVVEHLPKQHRILAANLAMPPLPENANNLTHLDMENTIIRAKHYLALARQYADPRLLGFAQSSIAPWINTPTPATELLVLQAMIKQADHQFQAALPYLNAALQQQPDHPQALLTRAAIQHVIGNYPAALTDCKRLVSRVATIISYTCIATTTGLSGQLAKSLSLLQRIVNNMTDVNNAADVNPEQYQWVISSMADMAERLNQPALAAQYYQRAIADQNTDNYVNEAYAEFLVQTEQYQLLLQFCQQSPSSDGLLVKQAFAEQQLNHANASITVDLLKKRFARAQTRGDQKHLREQAYFYLHVLDTPEKALALSRENWSHQREPIDTLLYFKAAIQQQDNQAIREITHWVNASGFQDARLDALINTQTY